MNINEYINEITTHTVRSHEAFIFDCHRHICTTLLNADSVDIQALNRELLEMSKEFYRGKFTNAVRVAITNVDGYYTTVVEIQNKFEPYTYNPYSYINPYSPSIQNIPTLKCEQNGEII